jgi:hypothetical protein
MRTTRREPDLDHHEYIEGYGTAPSLLRRSHRPAAPGRDFAGRYSSSARVLATDQFSLSLPRGEGLYGSCIGFDVDFVAKRHRINEFPLCPEPGVLVSLNLVTPQKKVSVVSSPVTCANSDGVRRTRNSVDLNDAVERIAGVAKCASLLYSVVVAIFLSLKRLPKWDG